MQWSSSVRHSIPSKKQGELICWRSPIKKISTIIHMLDILTTFDPDSWTLIKVFSDNVDLDYFNGVVGKSCFERMKQHKNVDESFFFNLLLDMVQLQFPPDPISNATKFVMIILSDFSILLMQLNLLVIFMLPCWIFYTCYKYLSF